MNAYDTTDLAFGDGTRVLREQRPLGQGGQGSVWGVSDRDDLVVKIYDRSPDDAQLRRLAAMLRARPLEREHLLPDQPPLLVWPTSLVEAGGRPVGYGMPRLPSSHIPLTGLLQKQVRLRRFEGQAHWRFLLGVAANLAYMTAGLHAEGFVVGDLSSTNAVADQRGFITLLDCDSFAFRDALTGEDFGCDVFTDDYAGPERHAGEQPTAHSDDFALAVLVYQLLTGGNHPFDGAPKYGTEESTRKDNILAGTSFLLHPDRVVTPAQLLPPEVVPPQLLRLARQAFGPGLRNPERRPRSTAWLDALDEARARVLQCPAVPVHWYGGHLTACPWCRRQADRQSDPFTALGGRVPGQGSAAWSARATPSAQASASASAGASASAPAGASASAAAGAPGSSGAPGAGAAPGTSAAGASGGPAPSGGTGTTAPSGGPSASGPSGTGTPPHATGGPTPPGPASPTAPEPGAGTVGPEPEPGADGAAHAEEPVGVGATCAGLLILVGLLALLVWGIVTAVRAVF
ncbi:hypothetical protein [Streptomyces sp. SID8352]|uniref:hypothetical protein n=1 Tax=Streptomyces sp. SID8352 TaxID=2690338 RepID=UPI00136D3FC9|nr:hypothetical protein [Streptomyces sp. SID8352]MYU21846.1 hypothetical protein [Streptomyces sp. SID8352]